MTTGSAEGQSCEEIFANYLSGSRKFQGEFGNKAFLEVYLPQYDLRGKKHLPGLRFGWVDEVERKKGLKNKEKESEPEK